MDRREVDNSESCSEIRRVEREKSDLFKKFKTTRAKCPRSQNVSSSRNMVENEPFMYKLVADLDAKVKTGQILTFESSALV